LEMKSDPVFYRYISEGFIKEKINLLKTEYDRVAALPTNDRVGVTNLEVLAFIAVTFSAGNIFRKPYLHFALTFLFDLYIESIYNYYILNGRKYT